MADVTLSQMQGRTNNRIQMYSNHQLWCEGAPVQTIFRRTHNRPSVTSSNSGNGTILTTDLRMTITPKSSRSIILVQWWIMYEVHHDNVFLVQRNGSLIGYNTARGNARYSGISAPMYDDDYSSTPSYQHIMWYDKPNTTSSRYYDICIRSSSGSNFTFRLNRTISGDNRDSHENGVSQGMIQEIYYP